MKTKSFLSIFLMVMMAITTHLFGQNIQLDSPQIKENVKFNYKSLIIPTVLIGYGVIGLESDGLKLRKNK